ncbi:glycoside hydrolase family 125 protein [Streptomyces sp. NPDC001351]|uniref:glycoside hydrolase family 125 protein n=1 Tax=Streptomyces sp. NPDC001351 TaxID=3364564 RepID=UPI0036BF6D95
MGAVDSIGATHPTQAEAMHESFHKDSPRRFARPWFSWANAMYAELALGVGGSAHSPGGRPAQPTDATAR